MPHNKHLLPILAILLLLPRSVYPSDHSSPKNQEISKIITVSEDIELQRLKKDVWIHTTYTHLEGYGRVPANGLLVIDANEAVLIDTPWNDEQTGALFEWVKKNLNARITQVVVCHSHDDCMGGLAVMHQKHAVSYASDQTKQIAEKAGKEVPLKTFSNNLSIACGSKELKLKYLGAGHTIDNIVAWLPGEKILFGGCLIRSAVYRTLGFIGEADIESWPQTLKKIPKTFPEAEIVVPGHGPFGGLELISHTIKLCEDYINKEN